MYIPVCNGKSFFLNKTAWFDALFHWRRTMRKLLPYKKYVIVHSMTQPLGRVPILALCCYFIGVVSTIIRYDYA
jgi:hypothetical protein